MDRSGAIAIAHVFQRSDIWSVPVASKVNSPSARYVSIRLMDRLFLPPSSVLPVLLPRRLDFHDRLVVSDYPLRFRVSGNESYTSNITFHGLLTQQPKQNFCWVFISRNVGSSHSPIFIEKQTSCLWCRCRLKHLGERR